MKDPEQTFAETSRMEHGMNEHDRVAGVDSSQQTVVLHMISGFWMSARQKSSGTVFARWQRTAGCF
jgi:hypothetical protein